MRLADFILESTESILAEWEVFARRIWPAGGGGGAAPDPAALRDHARDILRATAWDMKSPQTAAQQSDKSRGERAAGAASGRVDGASDAHAVGRVRSGFDLMAVVAEYRALRASVIRLWRDSGPDPDLSDVDDLTRFNESIDQSLTESIRAYTHTVDRTRLMFLAILGHDLRNPLNTVSMSADVLGGDDDLDAAARRKAAAGISTAVTAMGDMVRDLLDFAASGLGETMPLTPAPTDLGAVCRDVVAEAAAAAAHAARPLRLDATGDLAGEWDAARLRQVVSNLIGNALQHGSGPVDVRAAPDPTARSGGAGDDSEGGAVVLAVRNGGPPIPPDDLSTIFDPLVRGTSAAARRQRRPGSIGLGLYIAREVATAHGGTIGVASTAEAGTVFMVRLPRRRPGRA